MVPHRKNFKGGDAMTIAVIYTPCWMTTQVLGVGASGIHTEDWYSIQRFNKNGDLVPIQEDECKAIARMAEQFFESDFLGCDRHFDDLVLRVRKGAAENYEMSMGDLLGRILKGS